jgi:hypothetical protein
MDIAPPVKEHIWGIKDVTHGSVRDIDITNRELDTCHLCQEKEIVKKYNRFIKKQVMEIIKNNPFEPFAKQAIEMYNFEHPSKVRRV